MRFFIDGTGILMLHQCVGVCVQQSEGRGKEMERDLGMLVLIQRVNVALIDGQSARNEAPYSHKMDGALLSPSLSALQFNASHLIYSSFSKINSNQRALPPGAAACVLVKRLYPCVEASCIVSVLLTKCKTHHQRLYIVYSNRRQDQHPAWISIYLQKLSVNSLEKKTF